MGCVRILKELIRLREMIFFVVVIVEFKYLYVSDF